MSPQYFSMGPVHCTNSVQASIWGPPTEAQRYGLDSSRPVAGSGVGTGSLLSFGKEAVEHVPPPDRESRFYSQKNYFIVPKKDGRFRPI